MLQNNLPSSQFFSSLYIYQFKALQSFLQRAPDIHSLPWLFVNLCGVSGGGRRRAALLRLSQQPHLRSKTSSSGSFACTTRTGTGRYRRRSCGTRWQNSAVTRRMIMNWRSMTMKEADADGDGFISLAEFKDINGAGEGVEEVDLKEAFAVFDEDRDGKISAKELHNVLKGLGEQVTTEQCQEMVRGVDRDGDGMVSFQEFKVLMTGGGAFSGSSS